ncbi:UNVERIFIED_ORG: uncharacterized membrane protein YidH (DUF202 family) [Arthrobacter sp. UYCu721]
MQPERTNLAWGRTVMSMVVAATIFLRWTQHHGWILGPLVVVAATAALVIGVTRKQRFYRAIHGINQGHLAPDIQSVSTAAASVVILALMGICVVLFLPLE